MKNLLPGILFLGSLVLVALSCQSEIEEGPVDFGHAYFPLEIGKNWVYQVDSTIFDTTGAGVVITQSTSFSKETIVEKFTDPTGSEIYRIERSEKKYAEDPWVVRDVWSAQRTQLQALKTEENFKFIKMVFPLTERERWDGNRYIDRERKIVLAGETIEIFKNWEYQIISVEKPEQIGRFAFDQVTTISQAADENLIELRYSREKYARDIGLVYREMRILDTQNISAALPWEEKAQKGFILIQTLIDHY